MKLDLKELIAKVTGQTEFKTLLWTNPSPTSSFAPQTLNMDLTDYDEVEVSFLNTTSYRYLVPSVKCPIGEKAMVNGIFGGSAVEAGVLFGFGRVFNVYSDRIDFGNAAGCASGSTFAIRNEMGVPQKIYGIKYVGGVVHKVLSSMLTLGRGWA